MIVYIPHHHHSAARGLFKKNGLALWELGARRDLAQVQSRVIPCCDVCDRHNILAVLYRPVSTSHTSSASTKTLSQRSEPSRQTHFPSTSLQCTLDINFLPPDTELKARTEPPHNLLCELNSCEGGLLRVPLPWHRMTNRETICEGLSRVLLAWMTKS